MKTFVTVLVMVGAFGLAGVAAEPSKEAPKTHWNIAGDLEEACTCNAPCPCWFNSLPTRHQCGGGQVLFISKGRYGDVSLDGLAVAHFGQSPEGQTMMESFGNWNFSVLYIDERANPKQREALEAVSRVALPAAAAKKLEVRYVPITRTMTGSDNLVKVGSVATFQGRLLEGGLGGTPKIVDPPGADPIHHEYLQGRTSKLVYTDAGQDWNLEKSNYMRGHFDVNSEQYEKFTAGLAQKMAEMQKQK
jgi:hypothetical protein